MKKLTVTALIVCLLSLNIGAKELPSDEEMMRQGRSEIGKVGDLNALFDKAQGVSAVENQPIEVPSVSLPNESQSAVMRSMIKEREGIDLKKMLAADAQKKSGTDLIVFVSFSMPDDILASYSEQAKEAGATLVLRGLVENSITKTQRRAIPLNKQLAAWDVNPGLFRKFDIKRVPAIVLADSKEGQTIEDGCAPPSASLQVEGAVSIKQALLLMRQRGDGYLAQEAATRLRKLETQ